jgi:hypothetical protein
MAGATRLAGRLPVSRQAVVKHLHVLEGTRQLGDYLGALDVELTDERFTRLSEVSAVPLGMPHDIIAERQDTFLGGDASRVIRPAVPVS